MANDISFAFAEYLVGNQKNGLNILKKYAGKFAFIQPGEMDNEDSNVVFSEIQNSFLKTIRNSMKK